MMRNINLSFCVNTSYAGLTSSSSSVYIQYIQVCVVLGHSVRGEGGKCKLTV